MLLHFKGKTHVAMSKHADCHWRRVDVLKFLVFCCAMISCIKRAVDIRTYHVISGAAGLLQLQILIGLLHLIPLVHWPALARPCF